MRRSQTRMALTVLVAVTAAACGGETADPETTGGTGTADALEVVGTDALTFEPSELTADAGGITVQLTAEPAIAHDFVIEEGEQLVVAAGAGETAVGTVALEPGTYTFYCGVPGHRQAGMVGTLEVVD